MNIREDIRSEIRAAQREPSSRDLTILALLFLLLGTAVGGYQLLWKGAAAGWYWIIAGVVLCLFRLITPLFRGVYRVWLAFSVILGYFVSRILLTIIFFLVITPMGLIFRVIGKDPMERKLDRKAISYWTQKEQEANPSVERYEKQF
jgi:Saxitoxin biosynthesis operon protein SxtJ